MKIHIKKIKLTPDLIESIGNNLTSSIIVSDVTAIPGITDEDVIVEYDSLSPSEKIIVDNYINLIKNK